MIVYMLTCVIRSNRLSDLRIAILNPMPCGCPFVYDVGSPSPRMRSLTNALDDDAAFRVVWLC
jgi:hypothetical protein